MGLTIQPTVSHEQYTLPKLTWGEPVWTDDRRTCGYIISNCACFMIDKHDSSYNAWRRATIRDPKAKWLGFRNSIEAAKALCEENATA